MQRTLVFEKEQEDKWFVNLPNWKGAKEELEMVSGADIMLDIVSQGENKVRLLISDEELKNYKYELEFLRKDTEGGIYLMIGEFSEFEVWLCHVVKFVFGNLPKKLYCS